MRTIVALLVILVGSTTAHADRATTIAQDLQLSPDATARLASTLATYDSEALKLRTERTDIRRELMSPHTDSMSQKLLDDMLANERATVQLDEQLVTALRGQLAPDQLLRVFVLLNASEPEPPHPIAPPMPKSPRGVCNPFEQMHRCP